MFYQLQSDTFIKGRGLKKHTCPAAYNMRLIRTGFPQVVKLP